MNGGLVASLLGVGVFTLAPAAFGQAPAPPSSAAFAPAAPTATPTPAPPVSAAAPPAPAPAPATDAPATDAPAVAEPAPVEAPARSTSSLAAPSPAETPPPRSLDEPKPETDEPSSGLGLIIAGWSVSGVGAANLLLIPVCKADFYPHDQRDVCFYSSIAVGVIGLGVGIPMLVVGYNHRADHKKWEQHHAILSGLLHTQVAVQNESALVVYRGTF